jgi:preprotein translocase subunit SecA
MMPKTPQHRAPVDLLYRPERKDLLGFNGADFFWHRLSGRLLRPLQRNQRKLRQQVAAICALDASLSAYDAQQLQLDIQQTRRDLMSSGFRDDLVVRVFALIREVSSRTLGMKHYPSQLTGGLIMLQGAIAEMQTGEGKTLTATLTAGAAALAGWSVHVISVNDYLTERDAEEMRPVYEALGLTVATVIHGQEPDERRQAYRADITYCTNKEVAFDYLRDRLVLKDCVSPLRLMANRLHDGGYREDRLILPGLHFALVDEADSVMIDEARTPLVISGQTGDDQQQIFYQQAINLAERLEVETHYHLRKDDLDVRLTPAGQHFLEQCSLELPPAWHGTIRRESSICQALIALNCFHRDEQYIIREDKVQIVDEFTGRIMADRSWEKGLHQLIEVKEGVELSGQRESLARISYQSFFRRYLRLCGMTGTAHEVRGELWDVYGLGVMKVPTHRPVQRRQLSGAICRDADDKWGRVVETIESLYRQGRPVLVGTRSVAASEHLGMLLTKRDVPHAVLNARCDAEEADIVSRAGELQRVTVATNMAGRGTDIKLAAEVREAEGLHVILTERHEAGRIDRQLFGRCGRQGDPGSYESIVALDDQMFTSRHVSLILWVAKRFLPTGSWWWRKLAGWGILKTQANLEKHHARVRNRLLKQDQQRISLLSFSGRPD